MKVGTALSILAQPGVPDVALHRLKLHDESPQLVKVLRVVIVGEDRAGFLYHAWAESVIEGRWVAVDPTFGTVPADATHVKLVEGETLAELLPLADWIGQLKLRIVSVERSGSESGPSEPLR